MLFLNNKHLQCNQKTGPFNNEPVFIQGTILGDVIKKVDYYNKVLFL